MYYILLDEKANTGIHNPTDTKWDFLYLIHKFRTCLEDGGLLSLTEADGLLERIVSDKRFHDTYLIEASKMICFQSLQTALRYQLLLAYLTEKANAIKGDYELASTFRSAQQGLLERVTGRRV